MVPFLYTLFSARLKVHQQEMQKGLLFQDWTIQPQEALYNRLTHGAVSHHPLGWNDTNNNSVQVSWAGGGREKERESVGESEWERKRERVRVSERKRVSERGSEWERKWVWERERERERERESEWERVSEREKERERVRDRERQRECEVGVDWPPCWAGSGTPSPRSRRPAAAAASGTPCLLGETCLCRALKVSQNTLAYISHSLTRSLLPCSAWPSPWPC